MYLDKSFTLQTNRLKLRIPDERDFPHIFSATRYPGFNDGILWEAPKHPDELIAPLQRSIEAWEKGHAFSFSIEEKNKGDFYGRISIRETTKKGAWNTGFWTHPLYQGKGIMTEALQSIIHFGFTWLEAEVIEACYALWNKASEKVLLNNGMQFIEYIEKGFVKNGEWVPENRMQIDRRRWEALTP